MIRPRFWCAAGMAALLTAGACAPAPVRSPMPAVPAPDFGKRGTAENGMVASAHPLASEAGLEMLLRGGNAVDAAVAAAFAVGVVEPMMSGIGGSGGLMIWDQSRERAEYLDFYAVAPAAVTPQLDRAGHPARIVAVPGAVAGLLEAHERFGRLPRQQVLAPAILLAEDGFAVGPLLARTLAADSAKVTRYPDARRIFWPNGRPLRAGARLVQPELAATLRRVAAQGRDGFHSGPVADEIVRVLNQGGNPITRADLEGFTPRWRRPVCSPYRRWTVLSAPPPQSGMQIVQALNLLAPHELRSLGLPTRSAEAFHLLAGALRVSTADRIAYLADPDHVGVPANGVGSPAYAQARGALVAASEAPVTVAPGNAWAADAGPPPTECERLEPYGPSPVAAGSQPSEDDGEQGGGETTHLSVVDADGNAVSLTYTQGVYFGSGVWAAGTFLNSSMNIFSSNATGRNALLPNRTPRSTTTPSIVLEDGRVRMVVGSPGAARIPSAVMQTMVYILDFGLHPLAALEMPRFHVSAANPRVQFEQGFDPQMLEAARSLGYEMEAMPPRSLFFGGVHVIDRRGGLWVGAADPRRDGEVRGH